MFFLLCSGLVWAGFSKDYVGTTAAQFLKINPQARARSMGGVFTATSEGANAVYCNPAGICRIENMELSTTYIRWFQDINFCYTAYANKISGNDAIGFSFTYLTMERIQRIEIDSSDILYDTGETFRPYDFAALISYSKRIPGIFPFLKDTCIGGNIKLIEQKIDRVDARTMALDLGWISDMPDHKYSLGLVVQNIGPPIRFVSEADPLPLSIRLGCGWHPLSFAVLALDVNFPIDNNINLHFGAELHPVSIFAVRLGYRTNTISDLGALSGLSAGIGFRYNKYGIDYAWVPYGDLGHTHTVSMLLKF
jgi:hypothetical protein